jgi:signal transduction histidine kinase
MDQSAQRNRLLRLACILLVVAAGVRALYAGCFEAAQFAGRPHWGQLWTAGFGAFVLAYALTPQHGAPSRRGVALLIAQSVAALYLVWLYPSLIVCCLMMVVAWQIAWIAPLRVALAAALVQAAGLAAIRCVGQTTGSSLMILMATFGFQIFAVCAANLARSEADARDRLALANAELQATHALLTEGARMAERMRISRDLHDVMGHKLASLTVQLDVAERLARGPAAEPLRTARGIAAALLDEVRAVVSRVRVEPVDLRAALYDLTEGVEGLEVRLQLPPDLGPIDPARANAALRCVQELVTNTLRHASARRLIVELAQDVDGTVTVSARDDGRGGAFVEGQGLTGMRERFEMLGGSLAVSSSDGAGFSVRGAMPAAGSFR